MTYDLLSDIKIWKNFFGSHHPGGVHRGGGGGEEIDFLFFGQYHCARCLGVGFLGY